MTDKNKVWALRLKRDPLTWEIVGEKYPGFWLKMWHRIKYRRLHIPYYRLVFIRGGPAIRVETEADMNVPIINFEERSL